MLNKHSYNRVFYYLAFFYVIYFYIMPLLLVALNDFNVVTSYLILNVEAKYFSAVVGFAVFFFGFVFYDLFKLFFRNTRIVSSRDIGYVYGRLNWFFYVLVCVYIVYLIVLLADGSRIAHAYDVRQGKSDGNIFAFLVDNLFLAIKLSLIVVSIKFFDRRIVASFVAFAAFVEILGGIGRANLIFNFVIFLMLIFNFRASFVAKSMIVLAALFIPIILSMKRIIYVLSTSGSVDFSSVDFNDLDYTAIFSNFGHPLISFFQKDELVDITGYRYFYDVFQGFIFYFRVFGFNVDGSITYYNTKNLMGSFESVIPPGYLAFGYVQLSYLGVFIAGSFYRAVGRLGQFVYEKISYQNEVSKFIFSYICANSFYHGDFRIMVLSIFFPFIVMLCVYHIVIKGSITRL